MPPVAHPHCSRGLVNAELAPADQIRGRVNTKVLVAQMHALRARTDPKGGKGSFNARTSLAADGEVCLTKWPTYVGPCAFVTAGE